MNLAVSRFAFIGESASYGISKVFSEGFEILDVVFGERDVVCPLFWFRIHLAVLENLCTITFVVDSRK